MSSKKILLTNDDGYGAAGIEALYEAFKIRGFDVVIVAPQADCSGFSHGAHFHTPVRIEKATKGFIVHGTPVDCVYLALYHLKLDIGCVISGINDGPNLGDDIWYSGTVAAAREATLNGLPGIAVSQVYKNPAQLSMIAQKIVDLYGENPPQKGRIYNYNFPKDAVAYVQQCFLGRRQRGDTTETVTDLRGKNWVWLGAPKDGIIEKGSDFDVISKNMISLTIL